MSDNEIIDMIPPDDILEYYTDASNLLRRAASYMLQSDGSSLVALAPGQSEDTIVSAVSGSPNELGYLFTIALDVVSHNYGVHWTREFVSHYVSTFPESTQRDIIRRIREVTGVED